MASYVLSPIGGASQQFFSNAGAVLAGGLLYTYAAGTTTPQATYADDGGVTANANPIVLDSSGRVGGEVWLTYQTAYKFVLKDSAGNTIGTWDNVPDQVQANLISTLNTEVAALDAIANRALRYHMAANGSVASGVSDHILFDTKDFDNGNNYSTATYVFTAPIAGNYLVISFCGVTPAVAPTVGGTIELDLYKNSSFLYPIAREVVHVSDTDSYFLNGSVLVNLQANDTLSVWLYNNTSQQLNYVTNPAPNFYVAQVS